MQFFKENIRCKRVNVQIGFFPILNAHVPGIPGFAVAGKERRRHGMFALMMGGMATASAVPWGQCILKSNS